ncbi:hypothetical protein G7Z17_g5023 [Cylindrodendrum hubeiense]|uniref:Uncharacterized protein n=1 Tax=Cylindrodendrum hubeiense TaxID=595255 RepID=A0A9P5HDS9_9HYPO|nr:hypothetical protein G7Z17_g5023 [Cylindrodendrum hubeiense]
MRFQILSAIALSAVALADNHVSRSLGQLSQATVAFDNTLARWKGDYTSIGPIMRRSAELIGAINAAASVPEGTKTITVREVEEEANFAIANQLVQDVGSAVDTVIRLKPKIEAIPALGKPLALVVIKNIRDAVSGLGEAYGKLASDPRRTEAEAIIKRADDHLARGIYVFE